VSQTRSHSRATVRQPLIVGGIAALGFYFLIHRGVLQGDFVHRYFSSHPVEYIAMTMFFVGLAALAGKGLDLAAQLGGLEETTLGPVPDGGQSPSAAGALLARLEEIPEHLSHSYLVGRLRDALDSVRRKGTADGLDEHLRYAADLDAVRMHAGYSLVRVIIWAIPILGFLGTVIGITLAIAKLGPQDLENSLPEVVTGLKVAFDTTALALGLSIVLMFTLFIVERLENQLLSAVDERTTGELVGRFQEIGTGSDPVVASVQRTSEAVLEATEQLVQRQAKLWETSLEEAQQRWMATSDQAGNQLQEALAGAVRTGLLDHAAALRETETTLAAEHRGQLGQLQQALVANTESLGKQQTELAAQGDVLLKAVRASDHIRRLETSLNDNLAALAGERNFQETVMSLSAAIQLLNARLGSSGASPRVDLESDSNDRHAA